MKFQLEDYARHHMEAVGYIHVRILGLMALTTMINYTAVSRKVVPPNTERHYR